MHCNSVAFILYVQVTCILLLFPLCFGVALEQKVKKGECLFYRDFFLGDRNLNEYHKFIDFHSVESLFLYRLKACCRTCADGYIFISVNSPPPPFHNVHRMITPNKTDYNIEVNLIYIFYS